MGYYYEVDSSVIWIVPENVRLIIAENDGDFKDYWAWMRCGPLCIKSSTIYSPLNNFKTTSATYGSISHLNRASRS